MTPVDKTYIDNLSHTQLDKLPAVDGMKFMEALISVLGVNIVRATNALLLNQAQDRYSGMANFQERVNSALVGTTLLAPSDQVYIASIAHGVAIGRFSPSSST